LTLSVSHRSIGLTIATTQVTAGSPAIAVNYDNSPVFSFTLHNLCFGCTTTGANSLIDAPAACYITLTGFRGGDGQVGSGTETCAQTLIYQPTTTLGLQPLACTKYNQGTFQADPLNPACFTDVNNVLLTYSQVGAGAPLNSLTSVGIDDLELTINNSSCCGSGFY
jgi:hypothetical protein